MIGFSVVYFFLRLSVIHRKEERMVVSINLLFHQGTKFIGNL